MAPREYDDDVVVPSAINVLIGVWLCFAPFLVGYGLEDTRLNSIVCGVAIALFAYLRAARAARSALLSWANVALGAWLFVSGFVLHARPIPTLNETICGGLVALLALMSALTTRD